MYYILLYVHPIICTCITSYYMYTLLYVHVLHPIICTPYYMYTYYILLYVHILHPQEYSLCTQHVYNSTVKQINSWRSTDMLIYICVCYHNTIY